MAINVFEGARWIAKVVAVLAIVGTGICLYQYPKWEAVTTVVFPLACLWTTVWCIGRIVRGVKGVASAKAARNIRIAGDDGDGHDLTEVSQVSEFSTRIRDVFLEHKPRYIIETGTFLGTGTTSTLAKALLDLRLDLAEFYSIEVNPENHMQARRNLEAAGLDQRVRLLNGLSVPRALLPSLEQIEDQFVTNIPFDDVFVDHQETQRSALYYRETNFPNLPEDLLGYCLRATGYRPDFLLLDSGGHMGNIEFNYVIERLEGPCIIALDDVYHVKHRRSLDQIQKDCRFRIMHLSHEKFGFCIAAFDPGLVPTKIRATRILYVRPDAIGDALLSLALLPEIAKRYPEATIAVACQERVAELYQPCPCIHQVFPFDHNRVLQDNDYRSQLTEKIRAFGADIALCPVYSRSPLADLLIAASVAPERIGMKGDLSNQSADEKIYTDSLYTRLVSSRNETFNELDHHNDFLFGLGIESEGVRATVWTTDLDEAFAEDYFRRERLTGRRVLAFFPGAQFDIRIYGGYRPVLEQLASEEWRVLAFGSDNESVLCESICHGLPNWTNLCGTVTIRQVAALMRRCSLGLGAESGLSHLCSATGLRHAVVLGGGHFARFSPTSPLTTAAALPLNCYGCNWKCRYTRPHCVKDLHPNVLKRAVVLAQEESRAPRVVAQVSGFRTEAGGPTLKEIAHDLCSHKIDVVFVDPEQSDA